MSNLFPIHFQIPEILSIEPIRGLRSGGTLLQVTGKHLSCGSSFRLLMSGGQCELVNISSKIDVDIVYCRVPPAPLATDQRFSFLESPSMSKIQLTMDDYIMNENSFKFEYVSDPQVLLFGPTKTIIAGGIWAQLRGYALDNAQSMSLILSSANLNLDEPNRQTRFSFKSVKKIIFLYRKHLYIGI